MKICLVNSSYEGIDSPFEKYDELPNPGRYIPESRHEFTTRWVTKANAQAEIDKICEEKFDIYMNYMWGIESDDVAGVEATRYLESKGVTVLTNPSTFLAKHKLDLLRAADKTGLRIPRDTPGRYPKIVKYSDGYGSLKMDYASICHDEKAVERRLAFLEEGNTKFGVMVQDYIAGTECSAIVVEMGTEVVPMKPLQFVFPKDTPAEREFLTWQHKFKPAKDEVTRCVLYEGPHAAAMQKAAVDAFKAIGVSGGGGWARVDMRLEKDTGFVYVIEVNCIPVVFYPKGNALGDDLAVEETIPGGQASLFDLMLATKLMQLGEYKSRRKVMSATFDQFAPRYDDAWQTTGLRNMQELFAAKYDNSGTVLDVACGTGAFGHVLHKTGVEAEVTGIELSEAMAQAPNNKAYYKQPIRIGPMEELIMGAGEFDHVVCFGALHHVDSVRFHAVLARMFMLARKSVSFDLDDVDSGYVNGICSKFGNLLDVFNHTEAMEEFGVPKGWKLVHKERVFIFASPATGHDVYGYAMRFERV